MGYNTSRWRLVAFLQALALTLAAALMAPANAQQPAQPKAAGGEVQPAVTIKMLRGVWVEGPGFDITYGKDYEACSQRCIANKSCVMLEYYRPEKKCNLYDSMRPRLKGGSSFVGIKS